VHFRSVASNGCSRDHRFHVEDGKGCFLILNLQVDEEPCDCHPDGMLQFLQSPSVRAPEHGWDNEINGILQIPEYPADALSETNNLIESCGVLASESVRAFEASHIAPQVRLAQDTHMLCKCLVNSVSKEGKSKITIWKDQHHVDGFPSGNLLLEIIVRESHLDTNAMISAIRTKLSNLDACMLSIGGHVTKFNTCVKGLVEALNTRGETTTDLLIYLFKGCLVVDDKSFNLCVLRKQEEHDEGGTQTEDSLMNLAKNKFTLLKDAGRCNMPSAEEEKILALQAELQTNKSARSGTRKRRGTSQKRLNPRKGTGKTRTKTPRKRRRSLHGCPRNPKRKISASPSLGTTKTGAGAVVRPAASATGTDPFKTLKM
jgi:hypothetical protein